MTLTKYLTFQSGFYHLAFAVIFPEWEILINLSG